MDTLKAILLGTILWILGASFYSISFYIPIFTDLELQANLTLALSLIPLAWLGANIYYRLDGHLNGFKLATVMVSLAIVLDALITVPYLIIPEGGSYKEFFGAPAFWLIAAEYFLVAYSCWHFQVKTKRQTAQA